MKVFHVFEGCVDFTQAKAAKKLLDDVGMPHVIWFNKDPSRKSTSPRFSLNTSRMPARVGGREERRAKRLQCRRGLQGEEGLSKACALEGLSEPCKGLSEACALEGMSQPCALYAAQGDAEGKHSGGDSLACVGQQRMRLAQHGRNKTILQQGRVELSCGKGNSRVYGAERQEEAESFGGGRGNAN
ncbi:hypothetical protein L7F22_010763 [Adiantum nelumboides]|nr:hypothetical protein [Adiantum nelumboides]